MRNKARKLFTAALALTLAVTPVTVHADLDFSFFESDSPAVTTESKGFKPSTKTPFSSLQTKVKEAQATNKEVVGWLKVPGTNIDEPIVMNTSSYDYYLYRDWKGTLYNGISWENWYNFPATATYLDYRSLLNEQNWKSGTSKNLVLYGHNWNNLRAPFAIGNQTGYTMFGQLPSYTDINFLKENNHIYFSTGENEGVWRIFAVGYCEVSADFFYNNPNPSKELYQQIISEWKLRSLYNIDVDVDTNDRLLTLSTCTRVYGTASSGGAGENQRFVVVARLLRDGESENDTVNVTVNQNVKQPVYK